VNDDIKNHRVFFTSDLRQVVVNLLRTEAVIAKAGLWNLREDKTTMPPLARLSVTACSSMRQTELGDRSGRFLKATEGAKNRKEKSRNNKAAPSLQEAAESAIESLLNGSRFFLANPPRSLPVFAPSGKSFSVHCCWH